MLLTFVIKGAILLGRLIRGKALIFKWFDSLVKKGRCHMSGVFKVNRDLVLSFVVGFLVCLVVLLLCVLYFTNPKDLGFSEKLSTPSLSAEMQREAVEMYMREPVVPTSRSEVVAGVNTNDTAVASVIKTSKGVKKTTENTNVVFMDVSLNPVSR
jgi:hypothetical protein